MTSILTNTAAMTALQTLNKTNEALAVTQNRIATGLKVANASDNAAYWSIATTMRGESQSLATVQEAIGLGTAVVDVAYTGMKEAIEITKEIQQKFLSQSQFESGSSEHTTLLRDIDSLKTRINMIADSARFQGNNLLQPNGSMNLVTGLTAAGGASTTTVDGFDLKSAVMAMVDAETAGNGLEVLNTAAAAFGTQKSSLEGQSRFNGALIDAIDRGISALVDADMNEESTRLQALQVQQQLGIQALSIANQSPQAVLALFR